MVQGRTGWHGTDEEYYAVSKEDFETTFVRGGVIKGTDRGGATNDDDNKLGVEGVQSKGVWLRTLVS